MEKGKILFGICLVLVVSGVTAWLYVVPKVSEGGDNLTERVNKIEGRLSEQLVLSDGELDMDMQNITFWITHIGTANVTVSEIRVNNVLNSSGPGWEGPKILAPGQVEQFTLFGLTYFAEGFTSDNCHPLMVTTTNGNTFYFDAIVTLAPPSATEELEIEACLFNGTSGDSANTIVLTVRNTGTADLTVDKYKLGSLPDATVHDITDVQVAPGAAATVECTNAGWTCGVVYEIYLITVTGAQFVHTATAT